jgi:hypothetical protein
MRTITANELKKKGINMLARETEAIITVRGKARYIILDIELYLQLHELKLEIDLRETREDVNKGKFIAESVTEHIKRVTE